MDYHKPVLRDECLAGLALKEGGVYVDLTFGGGGHSRAILEALPGGRLIAFDQDPDAQANALSDPRFTLVQANFRFLKKMLRLHGLRQVDGILADFGVSSHQIDEGPRGFSLRHDAPLDMRMNPAKPLSAADVANRYAPEALYQILKNYGEVRRVKASLDAIIAARPLRSTFDLIAALEPVAPAAKRKQFLAQVFQALRIEVNEELKVIEEMLPQTAEVLAPGGRLVCLSYHSLEDRLVKNFLRSGNVQGQQEKDFFGRLLRPFEPLNRKPILPSEAELAANPRARSAKLRIGVKNAPDHE